MEKLITVFTPTYNRAHIIYLCYESLKKQTVQNFIWMVIDDGSTDNTGELIETWKEEKNPFEIIYVKKENGGLHTGYNTAIEHMTTELSVCIDSDDYMPENAIEIITEIWKKNRNKDLAGLVGLDYDTEYQIIGAEFPKEEAVDVATFLYNKLDGDKKYVIRNDLYKEVAPMPVYEGEKNFNPHYMALKISRKNKFLLMNQCLCIVDYQPDGMSANIMKQYVNSPRSFAEYRRLLMTLDIPAAYQIRHAVHYVSSSIFAKDKSFIHTSSNKLLTVIGIPMGIILNIYIRLKCSSKK